MKLTSAKIVMACVLALGMTGMTGCNVLRGQSTAGEYVDDATITTKIKAIRRPPSAVRILTMGQPQAMCGSHRSSCSMQRRGL